MLVTYLSSRSKFIQRLAGEIKQAFLETEEQTSVLKEEVSKLVKKKDLHLFG